MALGQSGNIRRTLHGNQGKNGFGPLSSGSPREAIQPGERNSFVDLHPHAVWLRFFAALHGGANTPDEQTFEPVPIDQGVAPGGEDFAEPLVPAAPQLSAIASAELIQSTDPEERFQQINSSRPDPFATVPIPPPPQVTPPPPAAPTAAPGTVATPSPTPASPLTTSPPAGTPAATTTPGSPGAPGTAAPGTPGAAPGTPGPHPAPQEPHRAVSLLLLCQNFLSRPRPRLS